MQAFKSFKGKLMNKSDLENAPSQKRHFIIIFFPLEKVKAIE